MENKKMIVAFLTLGCKVNQYETDAMMEILKENNFDFVPFEEKADIYIINTCSVTNMADRKSRQMIHKAKKMNPNAIVCAAGCYVQAAREQLEKDETIDFIIGNNKKKDIAILLEKFLINKEISNNYIDIGKTKEYEEMPVSMPIEHTRAYVKIQDGCNQFCSYCIIPYTRGRVRSRKPEDVINEINEIVKRGVKEVILTGIHLSSYGVDLEKISLISIIEEINQIEGLKRIRLGSLEPRIITEDFLERLVKIDKICPHFHLSLQSGCNETLKRMNRKYSAEEYLSKCQLIRKYFKEPAITTDVIVGFPGESEEEFQSTKEYLEMLNLYEMHIFKYSVRKGTAAEKMPNQIDEKIKTDRSNILLEMTKRHKEAYERQLLNKDEEVLGEELVEYNNKKYYVGHTKRYVKVYVNTDKNIENKIVSVKINDINSNIVFGNLI